MYLHDPRTAAYCFLAVGVGLGQQQVFVIAIGNFLQPAVPLEHIFFAFDCDARPQDLVVLHEPDFVELAMRDCLLFRILRYTLIRSHSLFVIIIHSLFTIFMSCH